MSRVSFLKRLFAVFVLPVFILAVVSFVSAQEGKADAAAPASPAGNNPLADAPITGRDCGNVIGCRHDGAGPFVPERQRIPDVGGIDVSAEQLEVGRAQAAERRPHKHLTRCRHERRSLQERYLTRPFDDQGAPHSFSPSHREDRTRHSALAPRGCQRRSVDTTKLVVRAWVTHPRGLHFATRTLRRGEPQG